MPIDFNHLNKITNQVWEGIGVNKDIFDRIEDYFIFSAQRDVLISGLSSLVPAFDQLFRVYCLADAAEVYAKEFEAQNEAASANALRFRIRNVNFQMFMLLWHSILEYTAITINEWLYPDIFIVTNEQELKAVSFNKLRRHLAHKIQNDTSLSAEKRRLYSAISGALNAPHAQLKSGHIRSLRKYRNTLVHRYLPGMDFMSFYVQRADYNFRLDPRYGRFMQHGNYVYYGLPELKYEEIRNLGRKMALNAVQMINKLTQIPEVIEVLNRSKNVKEGGGQITL